MPVAKKLRPMTYGYNIMTIELSPDKRAELQSVLETFGLEEFEEDVGDFKTSIMLDFITISSNRIRNDTIR